ncbi:MAG: alanyl-tRNA editing protein [Solobacterium sp.]|nr:alanyl-tRNA editing protein [Solobacterium sp.]
MSELNELYDRDAYLREFDARVISCTPGRKGYEVILSETAFYPEGGGQPGDTGILNGIPVTDTRKKNGTVIHLTDSPLQENTPVHGKINWERRFDHMQQHSGEHIFSGLIHHFFGYENIGFHLGDETVTLDFSGTLSREDLSMIELRANEIIWSDIETEITFPSEEELASLSYRSKKELHGMVRIVTFPGADRCACCGTHVRRSGEIGLIKVLSSQNRKSGTRTEIVCGKRALKYICAVYEENEKISHLLSAPRRETSVSVERAVNELGVLQGEKHQAQLACLEARKQELNDGEPLAVIFTDPIDSRDLRTFISQTAEEKQIGICAGFSGTEGSYQYAILSSVYDLRPLCRALNQQFSGKGGGPKEMVQGSLNGQPDAIRSFLESYISQQ